MLNKRRNNYLDKVENKTISVFYSGYKKHKSNDQYFPFSVNRNFFYLTNIEQENVALVLIKGNNFKAHYLFIEEVDPVKALWDGATYTFEEASNLSNIPLENIKNINTLDTFINTQLGISRANQFGLIEKVYFDLEKPALTKFLTEVQVIANDIKRFYPHVNILNSYAI